MRPEKNGVILVTVSQSGDPDEAYYADQWKCKSCGHSVLSGYGAKSIMSNTLASSAEFLDWIKRRIDQGDRVFTEAQQRWDQVASNY